MDDSFNIDEELLQWLTANLPSPPPPPPQIPPQCGGNISARNDLGGNLNVETTPIEEPPAHNNVATFVAGSSSTGKGKQHQSNKMKSVDIERQRRQEMSALYASLRSILPAEYIRGKRSMADHLQEAVKYIKDMEGNIAELSEKRNTLLKGKSSRGSSSSSAQNNTSSGNSNPRELYIVSVKKCGRDFFEIVLKTNSDDYEENVQRLPLSKGLHLLNKEGLSVASSITCRVGNDVMHTIHAQVTDGMIIDQCLLKQQLMDCYA